jgi:hypothetical protein
MATLENNNVQILSKTIRQNRIEVTPTLSIVMPIYNEEESLVKAPARSSSILRGSLKLAAPGLHKKDFKIEVNGNVLTVSGQKEENKEDEKGQVTRQEYNYSSFSRSFILPGEVEQDKISASYDGGILKLVLPKNENAAKKAKKAIAIK